MVVGSKLWREIVKQFQRQAAESTFDDPVSVALADLLKAQEPAVSRLVRRAERLAQALQKHPPQFVLCHADIHAANLLIEADGRLHVVDWDTVILAPKERDLMFSGGGQFAYRRTPQAEDQLFYKRYGQTQIDQVALAYYRYERIIEDIAVFCEIVLLSTEGGEDREQSYKYLISNFLPNGILDIAYNADKTR